jgi:hypothetical protein
MPGALFKNRSFAFKKGCPIDLPHLKIIGVMGSKALEIAVFPITPPKHQRRTGLHNGVARID